MTVDDARQLISDRFLGSAGIHGVGLRRHDGAVTLYVSDEHDQSFKKTLGEIARAIAPVAIVVIASPSPRQMTSPG